LSEVQVGVGGVLSILFIRRIHVFLSDIQQIVKYVVDQAVPFATGIGEGGGESLVYCYGNCLVDRYGQ
jgi:hypothetical protein